jgi:glycine cleavage system aminomethyltransferase T
MHLLMALHGHSGLPTQIGGAVSAPMPPAAALPGGGGMSDTQVAKTAEQHLMAAVQAAHDPTLKATFSTALAALHKYLAQDEKEHQQALQGKFSPKIMAKASSGGR